MASLEKSPLHIGPALNKEALSSSGSLQKAACTVQIADWRWPNSATEPPVAVARLLPAAGVVAAHRQVCEPQAGIPGLSQSRAVFTV